MRRDPVWLTSLAIGLVACGRVAILLGGPVKSPDLVYCDDGTTCPTDFSCPVAQGGRCEYVGPEIDTGYGMRRDAGRD